MAVRVRKLVQTFIFVFICFLVSAAVAGTCPLEGTWAYAHDHKAPVLSVNADGTCVYFGKQYAWEDQEGFLALRNDDESAVLRYLVTDEAVYIYPETVFEKTGHTELAGLFGVWKGVNSGSSFAFTPDGYFLEDGAFAGQYTVDEDAGTFLLNYGGVFADTLCYYTLREDGLLTVAYPYDVVPVN